MVYINLIIIVLIILLAILCRVHKSKYKAVKGGLYGCFVAMGEELCSLIDIKCEKTETLFRRIYVLPPGKEKRLAREFIAKLFAFCIAVLFGINLIAVICFVIGDNEDRTNDNTIVRQDYDGKNNTYSLKLDSNGEMEVYEFVVAPVKYTQEEFLEQAECIYEELAVDILGENTDMQHIRYDLCLTEYDKSGMFHINWFSGDSSILSSNGKLNNLLLAQSTEVTLGVSIEYEDYETEYSYNLLVEPAYKDMPVGIEAAKLAVEDIEKKSRNSKTFTLPDEVAGVKVSVEKKKSNVLMRLGLAAVLVCIVCVVYKFSKLEGEGEHAEDLLRHSYVEFADSLCLLIESGMTIKGAIEYIAVQPYTSTRLSDELIYAINMIDAGYDEAYMYEHIGQRIGIPEYIRLFGYLGQYVRKGNSNIISALNDCAYEAAQSFREQIRKKGEIISTKLLFPMVILLADVMMIIIVPAILNF